MDIAEVIARLSAVPGRGPGTDAERRAARWLQDEIRSTGREAELETHWVRPSWALAHAGHAALAVAGSVLAVRAPVAGLVVLAAVLASVLLEGAGRSGLLRRLTLERATQNVVSPPPPGAADPARVRLVITAHYDAGRTGLVYRDGVRRLVAAIQRRACGTLPAPLASMAAGVALLVVVAALRTGGLTGTWLGAVALLPTLALTVAVALLLDVALSAPGPAASDDGSGVAVVLALAAALDAVPPRRLAVELVLAGAGEGPALGFARYVRARRRWDRGRVVVLHVAACGGGSPRWWTSDGQLVPVGLHPQLGALAARVAREEVHLRARPLRGRGVTGALVARRARWPAIAVGARTPDGRAPRSHQPADTAADVEAAAVQATLELALALVDGLDRELARTLPARDSSRRGAGAGERFVRARRPRRRSATSLGAGGRAGGADASSSAGR